MRLANWTVAGFLGVAVGTTFVAGQGVGPAVQAKAPIDKAVGFSVAELEATFKDMDARKLATLRLLEGGSYNVNIRRLVGSESALVHPKTTDVWVVREGSGTLITGGALIDATIGPNGDQRGTGIRGGFERVIKTGDVIFIPAGVPHGVKESKSITWLNIRFDTR
jgi:mannose-6-phosphate isomerase-like protein (cupin superfamily)